MIDHFPTMANSPQSKDRRRFLRIAVIGGIGVITAGAGSASVFMPPATVKGRAPGPRPLLPMIKLGGLGANEPLPVQLSISVRDGWRLRTRQQLVYVLRTKEGDNADAFKALSAICTHAGCTVQWNESDKRFICPCHDAQFEPDGTHIEGKGPAPRDMDGLEVAVAEHEGRPWLFVDWREFETGTAEQTPRAQA